MRKMFSGCVWDFWMSFWGVVSNFVIIIFILAESLII